jgi:hypothetical protein
VPLIAYSRMYPILCMIAWSKAIEAALMCCDTGACRSWQG